MKGKKLHPLIRLLRLILPVVLCLGLLGLNVAAPQGASKALQWHLVDEKRPKLLSTEDLLPLVETVFANPETQQNLDALEKAIKQHPAVKHCQVWKTVHGQWHAKVSQRNPCMRLVHHSGRHRYIDDENHSLPAFLGAPHRVIAVSGHFPLPPEGGFLGTDSLFARLFRLQQLLASDPFWLAMTEQLEVLPDSQFVLIPKIGNHEVWLGTIDQMQGKLNKLKYFYTFGLHEEGWKNYRQIDARFKAQIVCRSVVVGTQEPSNLPIEPLLIAEQ